MEIRPFDAVGPLRFGRSRAETRRVLGARPISFQKVPGANETDAYNDVGLHLYFNNDDRLEFVEAFAPANTVFFGLALLGRPVRDVEGELEAMGLRTEVTDVGRNEDKGTFLNAIRLSHNAAP